MDISLRLESESDYHGTENVFREAFWDVYCPGASEHFIARRLRKSDAFIKDLAYVAEADGRLVGAIIYTREKVINKDAVFTVITFGPVGVLPEYQGKGVGSALINHTLDIARSMGFPGVFIFGDPDYYCRFGFKNAENFSITTALGDNPDPFMGLELSPGAMSCITGAFFEDDAFDVDDAELAEFEKLFPKKESHVTDSRIF